MHFRRSAGSVLIYIILFPAITGFGAITSENNDRLSKALKEYPEADTNKDGILTFVEARAYRQKKVQSQARRRTVDLGEPAADKGNGYSGLYMGHSFFRPCAQELDRIVEGTRIAGHKQLHVMAGGINGSPLKMWTNSGTRSAATRILDTGDIELLVMTGFSPETSSVEHYSRWFDYAISNNPSVTFMVAMPWAKGLHESDDARLEALKTGLTKNVVTALIEPLRKKYPKNKLLYCPYGLGTVALVEQFNAGTLPGVKYLLDNNKSRRKATEAKQESLFKDETSHPGELVTKVGALLWLQTLYDIDVSTLNPQKVAALPKIDIHEIAAEVHKKIAPLNAEYEDEE